MYLPPHFTETDRAEIDALVDPLAALVMATLVWRTVTRSLVAGAGRARHVRRRGLCLAELVSRQGGARWCRPGITVHVHGRISFQHDDKAKRAVVGRLTTRFERETNGVAAWKMADAPADFMAEQLDAIVGISIAVDRVEAKSKLSQNRAPEDFAQRNLSKSKIALTMRGRQRNLVTATGRIWPGACAILPMPGGTAVRLLMSSSSEFSGFGIIRR